MKQEILKILTDNSIANKSYAIKKHKNLVNWLNQYIPYDLNLITKLYWIKHDLTDFPKCEICQAKITRNIYTFELGYIQSKIKKLSCGSKKCRTALYKESYKQTCLKKYGVENVFQRKEIKEKIKKTNIKKYGVEHFSQTDEYGKLIKQTSLAKYGVEHFFKTDEFKENFRQHNLEQYGVENYMQTDEFREKSKETCLERYGVKFASQSDEVKEKIIQTNKKRFGVNFYTQTDEYLERVKQSNNEKYGCDFFLQTDEFKEKSKKTCLEKYGVKNVGQSDKVKEKTQNTNLKKYGAKNYNQSKHNLINKAKNRYQQFLKSKFIKPLFSENDLIHAYLKKDVYQKEFDWQCLKHNHLIKSNINKTYFQFFGEFVRCDKCHPYIENVGTSKIEQEIIFFVKNIYEGEIKENIKSIINPLELDIYIPEKKIAIEFNGLYWHSEMQGTDKNYHLNKTNLCEDQDIHLIHIFENEWLYKQEIVKSRLKNIFGISDRKIYARNCEVKEIDNKTSAKFLEENHLQGNVNSSIRLGLFYKDELVSLMTFSKTRFSKKYEYEMLRFCNLLNTSVIGSASKLLKYFEKTYNPKSIVSYADRRCSYSKKNLYDSLGFEMSDISPPNYWYWKNAEILESRVKYQKHKLSKILENFNPEKTESQNMLDNGYNRIFDCGNLVYVKFFEKSVYI